MAQKNNLRVFDIQADTLGFEFEYNPSETRALQRNLAGKANLTLDDIRRVALWKLDRIVELSEETLTQLRNVAIATNLTHDSPEAIAVLEALVGSPGVGFPMASTILKFLRPDVFPIIDVRAYRALEGRKLWPGTYSVRLYLEYATKLKQLADTLKLPLARVDEQLYCFDRQHNGTI